MQRVLVLGDERKGGTGALVAGFADWLQHRGHRIDTVTDRESSLADRQADLVVVFGGDGSLLGAARRMGQNQMPTLGINRGRLGFLTAFEQERAKEAVELALQGKLLEERRLLLWCSVIDPHGGEGERVLCMNDGVVSRAAVGGMITLRAARSGAELATYRGDGLIVATAAGSTAYSMAAGGPVLAPGLDALVLTPLASHTLSARPLVVPVDDGVAVEVLDAASKKYAYFQIDGQVRMQVAVGARAVLRPAPFRFRHLGPGPQHFFEVLRAKFGFAHLPRERQPGNP
ncbi:MAG TPA: NAD(+)/NADH kinase [Planctomycetota bacterium]|nr:NAD(+)/NADH kinase [Planctomycetota bacterium]